MSAETKSDLDLPTLMREYARLVNERKQALGEIVALQDELSKKREKLRSTEAEMVDVHYALTVLGRYAKIYPPDLPSDIAVDKPLAESAKPNLPIRVQAENALRSAYPDSLSSREVREKLDRDVKENAVGMMLYRLLKEGVVTRKGRDWFFVPPDKREKPATPSENMG